MQELIIWRLYLPTSDYIRSHAIPFPIADQTLALEQFLGSDVRNDATYVLERLIKCQDAITCEGFSMNVTDLTKISHDKIALTFTVTEEKESLIISFNDLIKIIKTWGDLVEKKTPYIILERVNNNYSIKGAETLDGIIKP